MSQNLKVIILKPSKYGLDDYVDRFRRGFMPNATVPFIRSVTPATIENRRVEVHCIDEYVQADLSYLNLLRGSDTPTLLALVGAQSNQIQRALDLAAYARSRDLRHCVLGGSHAMTCDTSAFQGCGVSIAASEAETVWRESCPMRQRFAIMEAQTVIVRVLQTFKLEPLSTTVVPPDPNITLMPANPIFMRPLLTPFGTVISWQTLLKRYGKFMTSPGCPA